MTKLFNRIAYAIVPAVFLAAAGYFFKLGAPIAGGVCIVAAFLTARN